MTKILLTILLLFSTSLYANDFTLSSIDEALKLSKSSGKQALIIFGSPNCQFCDALKNEILETKNTQNYIVCYIDISNEENKPIKNQYNINMIPDSRIFLDQKEISRFKGFQKNKYIEWLKKYE